MKKRNSLLFIISILFVSFLFLLNTKKAFAVFECKAYRYNTNGCSGSGTVARTWDSATDADQSCATCNGNSTCLQFYTSNNKWGCMAAGNSCDPSGGWQSGKVECTTGGGGGGNPTRTPTPGGGAGNPTRTPTPIRTSTPTTPPNATRTPTPPTSANPTVTKTPTPRPPTAVPTKDPLEYDPYRIPIGQKQSLSIQIGGNLGDGPKIRFKAKLNHTQNNPDMYLKLRVKDELAFTSGGTDPTCTNPGSGGKDFLVPVKSSDGIYSPSSNISASPPSGIPVVSVSADGWITLGGMSAGKYYSFILKAEKTRGELVVEHIQLTTGTPANQDFDWTATPLEPGDLPDPNKSEKQDCAVNVVDLSLITSRIGATGSDELKIADVNYDSVVNGNDVSKVVNTLSTKPDDDL